MSNIVINSNCKVINCHCGAEPVIEITATDPVYVDYETVQTVYCPKCYNKVSGKKGFKMWNALMRVMVRNDKANEYQKKYYGRTNKEKNND